MEVLTFLLALLGLEVLLLLHLVAEPFDLLALLLKLGLLELTSAPLVLLELDVARLFVGHDLRLEVRGTFLLALLEQLVMLLLLLVVFDLFLECLLLALLALRDLLCQLLSDEPFALGVPGLRGLDLLEVQHRVELLNGRPLILLIDLRVDFGRCTDARRHSGS